MQRQRASEKTKFPHNQSPPVTSSCHPNPHSWLQQRKNQEKLRIFVIPLRSLIQHYTNSPPLPIFQNPRTYQATALWSPVGLMWRCWLPWFRRTWWLRTRQSRSLGFWCDSGGLLGIVLFSGLIIISFSQSWVVKFEIVTRNPWQYWRYRKRLSPSNYLVLTTRKEVMNGRPVLRGWRDALNMECWVRWQCSKPDRM